MIRLAEHEVLTIKQAVASADPNATVYLFGSRTDPKAKGGDIDLLVLSDKLEHMDKVQILKEIFETLEEQKIDMHITKDLDAPFVQVIMDTAAEL